MPSPDASLFAATASGGPKESENPRARRATDIAFLALAVAFAGCVLALTISRYAAPTNAYLLDMVTNVSVSGQYGYISVSRDEVKIHPDEAPSAFSLVLDGKYDELSFQIGALDDASVLVGTGHPDGVAEVNVNVYVDGALYETKYVTWREDLSGSKCRLRASTRLGSRSIKGSMGAHLTCSQFQNSIWSDRAKGKGAISRRRML